MTQGALYSLANIASLDNAKTNIRFNEIYLGLFVLADTKTAEQYGCLNSLQFSAAYEKIIATSEIKGSRLFVCKPEDLKEFRWQRKLE